MKKLKIYFEFQINENLITPVDLFTSKLSYTFEEKENADIIFYNKYPLTKQEIINIKPNKKTFLLWITDELESINIENLIIFRTSINKSSRTKNEFVFPWCTPILFKETNYSIQNKPFDQIFTDTITIGFCGNIRWKWRHESINYFEKSENINCNFIKRDRFIRGYSQTNQEKFRNKDFIENMKNNIFNLSVRGGGNWSLRFYETMAYGRIPVLYKTDTLLPFENDIDWDNIIIKSSNLEELEKKMIEWYNKGPEFIKQKQIQCRETWNKYLSIEGFASNFYDNI